MQLAVLSFLIAYLPFCACLDVAVSPGTPLDWLSEYPFYGPQPERGRVPIYTGRKPEEPGLRHRTIVREPREPTGSLAIPNLQDAMSFARIITSDVVGHLDWVNPTIDRMPDRPWEAARKYGLFVSYGPQHTLDSHWFAMGIALRFLLHPKRITPFETRTLLTRLGPQVLHPLSTTKAAGPFANFFQQFQNDIPPIPLVPPAIKATSTSDPFLAMAERLAIVELANAYVYCLQAPFAPRSRALGEAAVPAFTRLLTHPHPLVRENATLLLGGFISKEACDALCTTAAMGKDAVCRVRAAYALGSWKNPDATRTLLSVLRRQETTIAAIQALGRIGGKEAAQAIFGMAETTKSLDFLFTAVPALGRCGVREEKILRLLARLNLQRLLSLTDLAQPAQAGGMTPDSPDAPETKAAIVEQFAQIALARLGDDKARTYVLGLWNARRAVPPVGGGLDPARARIVGRGMISQDPLSPVYGPCTYYFLEALPELGQEGAEVLAGIFQDLSVDGYVRMRAIWEYPRCDAAQADAIEEVLVRASDAAIRAAALQSLLRLDPDKAREAALKTVAQFSQDRGTSDAGADVVMAFEIIGDTGGADIELLIAAYRAAAVERVRARPPIQVPGQPVPVNRVEIEFVPEVLPHVLIELGRTGAPAAEAILSEHLRREGSKSRAEAALGLGAIATTTAAATLLDALADRDAWVRYCAFRGLEAIRKGPGFQDWIFGESRCDAWRAEWRTWLAGMPEKPPPAKEPAAAPPDIARPAEEPTAPPEKPPQEAPREPVPAVEEVSIEHLLEEVRVAARTGDVLARERVHRTLVARAREALPLIIAELAKPAFPVALIDILEEVTQQKFGLNPTAWRTWWDQRMGTGTKENVAPAPTAQ